MSFKVSTRMIIFFAAVLLAAIPSAAQSANVNDLKYVHKDLEKRIESAKQAGKISRVQEELLLKTLNQAEPFETRHDAPVQLVTFVKDGNRYRLNRFSCYLDRCLGSSLSKDDQEIAEAQVPDVKLVSDYIAINEPMVRIGLVDNLCYQIRERIELGIKHGYLTESEAKFLNSEFYHIRELRDRWASVNGYVPKCALNTLMCLSKELRGLTIFELDDTETAAKVIPVAKLTKVDRFRHTSGSPYIWTPSIHGGFYELTGRINGLFPEQELSRYGGQMRDGTAISNNHG